jgi:DNA-binding MurR/RpiR family transcriptional regulator
MATSSANPTPQNGSDAAASKDHNIIDTIARLKPTLKRGSLQVAVTVLADPSFIAHASLAELSARAGVSDPTVLRFCSTVGCDGFREFKVRLVQSLTLGASLTHSVLEPNDAPDVVATKIFDHTITSLDWTRKRLDRAAIGRAVDLLLQAQRIEFVGFGASGIVALDAQQRFPLFGVPCNADTDAHQQLIAASLLKPRDVLVAISHSGTSRVLIEVVRTARERGATVIAITGSDSPITRFADVTLIAETLENTNIYTPTVSRLAALVVVDILSTSVSLMRGEAHHLEVQEMKKRLSDRRQTGVL